MKKAWIALAAAAVVIVLYCMSVYNSLVQADENVNTAWAQVETVLQRRYDLIPNLVNTVKGYAKHESGIFEEVAKLRSQWGAAKGAEAKAQASTALEGALGRLIAVAENYPELKANQNFIGLQDELSGTENRITVERQRYNGAVREYNVAIRRFPANVVAGKMGFTVRNAYFASEEKAAAAPKVEF